MQLITFEGEQKILLCIAKALFLSYKYYSILFSDCTDITLALGEYFRWVCNFVIS